MKAFDDGEGSEILTAHYDTDGGVSLRIPPRPDIPPMPEHLANAYADKFEAWEPPTPRRQALTEAADLIDGGREKDYGPPAVNFQRIADVWDAIVPKPGGWRPADVAVAMIGLKLARTPEKYKRDTYLDIAGYAALAIELEET